MNKPNYQIKNNTQNANAGVAPTEQKKGKGEKETFKNAPPPPQKKKKLTGDVAVVNDVQGKLPDGMLIGPALC